MLNSELLQLHPQHLAELRGFYKAFSFKDVEIAARDIFLTSRTALDNPTCQFAYTAKQLEFDTVLFDGDRGHAIFTSGEDNIFYCYSFAQLSEHAVECIIFKLID